MGNRIAKHIVEPNQRTRVANASLAKSRKCGKLLDGTRLSSTYYILEAQSLPRCIFSWLLTVRKKTLKITIGGNPLAMYELDYAASSFELTERQIYGSARLGSLKTKVDVFGSAYEDYSDEITTHAIGDRNYELSNHLGNILTVISDKLHPVDDGNGAVASYTADLVMSCDYSPFGVTLDGRGVEGGYRYGFQGYEGDSEVKGSGNSYTTEFRQYDPRVGRWLSVDPLFTDYPDISSYVNVANSPNLFVDLDGRELILSSEMNLVQKIMVRVALQRLTDDKVKLVFQKDGSAVVKLINSNNYNDKPNGTDLIRRVVQSDKTCTLKIENHFGFREYANREKSINGKGANTEIYLDPTDNSKLKLRDPETGEVNKEREPTLFDSFVMGLAHELIHAEKDMRGVSTDFRILAKHTYDDGRGNKVENEQSLDELETVGLEGFEKPGCITENQIRKEQKLKPRATY